MRRLSARATTKSLPLSSLWLPTLLLLAAGCSEPIRAPGDGGARESTDEAAQLGEPPGTTVGILELRGQARVAREAGDLDTARDRLAAAHELAPQNPIVTMGLAEVLAAGGDREKAIDLLRGLAEAGLSLDLTQDEALASLDSDPRFAAVLEAMERNREPTRGAEIVCRFDTPGLMPEGVDLDPTRRRVVLGSFARGQLVTADFGCASEELLPAGSLGAVTGVRVDAVRDLVWAASNARDDGSGPGPEVVAVRLSSGEVVRRKRPATEEPVLLNDIAVTNEGTVFVTETLGNAILRTCLDCEGLEVFVHSPALPYPNGVTLGAGDDTLFVAHAAGISRIDTRTGAEARLGVPPGAVTVGIDGLYYHRGSLLGVQNQPFYDRVVLLALDEEERAVEGIRVLNARHPGGMFHSTGFVSNGRFLFNGVAGDLQPPAEDMKQESYLLAVSLEEETR